MLVSIASHAKSAEGELGGVGGLGAPVLAKQMTAAMLRYSISLGELVDQCNRSVIDCLQAGLSIRAITESNADDTLIRWLTNCAELATGEHPVTKTLPSTRELADLLVASIRAGRIDDTLRLPPTEPAPSDTDSTPAATRFDSGSAKTDEPFGTACATAAETASEWGEIVTANDDMVSRELLVWAGLSDVWSRCQERWERSDLEWDHNFVSEVAESCTHIFINEEEWDDEMPGHSGVSYTIETNNPEALRQELRDELACQLRSWREELRAQEGC